MNEEGEWVSLRDGDGGQGGSPCRRTNFFVVYAAPIVSFILIGYTFVAATRSVVLNPGVRFELPPDEFSSGMKPGASAVLLVPPEGNRSLLFFDGVRYDLADATQKAGLEAALAGSSASEGWNDITLFADGDVPHREVMLFVATARRAGLASVNVAIREDGGK